MNIITAKTAITICILSALCFGCRKKEVSVIDETEEFPDIIFEKETELPEIRSEKTIGEKIADAAYAQIGKTTIYDPAYVRLEYPMGDLPVKRGVCTDVVIRSLRGVGVDLQKTVHEDMKKNFKAYPQNWGLAGPDKNIDHRRVPNQRAWFKRKGYSLSASEKEEDYRSGDIVTWKLTSGRDHIGVVVLKEDKPFIVHNIGRGARHENCLFSYTITGHYRLRE